METSNVKKMYELLDKIPVTDENEEIILEVRECLLNGDFVTALQKIQELQMAGKTSSKRGRKPKKEKLDQNQEETEETTTENEIGYDEEYDEEDSREYDDDEYAIPEDNDDDSTYPSQLSNPDLENKYMGLLLNQPKAIVKYYFLFRECYFENPEILNLYKSVLFTEGGKYTPEIAKNGFNFAKDTEESFALKQKLKAEYSLNDYKMEDVYIELKKLFTLRKSYSEIPIQEVQDEIVDITNYKLYHDMSVEEVESAIRQVNDTGKFKRGILNKNLSTFLKLADNNLTNGLEMPFKIISTEFKGIRKGETMAFAMPSNSGKSRFTTNLAAYVAFIHKKKVLVISNEMSEEKMKLCLITTILNNPEIQKKHGQMIRKTEGELLEFKFRPDMGKKVKVDEEGFVIKEPNETQTAFNKRLSEVSSEYNRTIAVTDWVNKELNNSIYFINITDHTNDELRKVIMNYYYKEKIEYVFYDTLKTDTANIGVAEELKKTATILSNLAQNFNMFICATLQLAESKTLPINMDVNDLAVSRTVKEVLDTLCLMKQINRENLKDYEYSLEEVDDKFFDIKIEKDPDVRYYACVVDKNRAGAKPKLLFRINLAYNSWEELGYLKLKQ